MKENAVVSCIFDPSHIIGKIHCLRKNRVQLTVMPLRGLQAKGGTSTLQFQAFSSS